MIGAGLDNCLQSSYQNHVTLSPIYTGSDHTRYRPGQLVYIPTKLQAFVLIKFGAAGQQILSNCGQPLTPFANA